MRRTQTLLVIVLVGAVVLMHQPLRRLTFTVLRLPLVVAESILSALAWLPQLPTLAHDNAALRSELASQQLELVRLRETVRHVSRAQALRKAFDGSPGIMASIISRMTIPTQHIVVLDKGARDGVALDGILLDANGLLGRVLEVYPTTSLAILVTDPNSRIACLVERSRESGLLVGTGGHRCQLLYLDLEADVVERDRVVTAGLGGPFPKGVLVGTVVKVVRDERSAQVFAWVRPAVALNRVEEVLCLSPSP